MRSQRHKHVIVIEEHAPQGGLAPRTKQIAWDTRGDVPARHLHAAGRIHPQLRQPRRPAQRPWHRYGADVAARGSCMNETVKTLAPASNTASLAIYGGDPVRKTPMPPRLALGEDERRMVIEVLDHYAERKVDPGYQGTFEKIYTDAFVDMMGGGYADAVATGTSALYVAVAALDLPKGSEVLVSPITDPGTLAAIVLNGLKPRLMDSKPDSYNVGPEQLAQRITKNVSGSHHRACGRLCFRDRQDCRDCARARHQDHRGLQSVPLREAQGKAGRHLRRHRRIFDHVPEGAHDRAVGRAHLLAQSAGFPQRIGPCRSRQAALAEDFDDRDPATYLAPGAQPSYRRDLMRHRLGVAQAPAAPPS